MDELLLTQYLSKFMSNDTCPAGVYSGFPRTCNGTKAKSDTAHAQSFNVACTRDHSLENRCILMVINSNQRGGATPRLTPPPSSLTRAGGMLTFLHLLLMSRASCVACKNQEMSS
jgi:hypothetical protein